MSLVLDTPATLAFETVDLPVDIAGMGEFAARMIRTAIQALLDVQRDAEERAVVRPAQRRVLTVRPVATDHGGAVPGREQ